MLSQSSSLRRCATCQRWQGWRRPLPGQPDSIEYDPELDRGLCQGGPWDGDSRSVRNACGRWMLWEQLTPVDIFKL